MPVQGLDLSAVTDATFNGSAVEQINLNGTGVWTKPASFPDVDSSWTLNSDSTDWGGSSYSANFPYSGQMYNYKGFAGILLTGHIAGTETNSFLVVNTQKEASGFPLCQMINIYPSVARGRWSPPEPNIVAEYANTGTFNMLVTFEDGTAYSIVQNDLGTYSSVYPLYPVNATTFPTDTILSKLLTQHARIYFKQT